MDYRYGPIWRYFTEEERYTLKCKICDSSLSKGYIAGVNHLKCKHPEILEEIQNKFEHSWISAHFILNTSNDKVRCKICCYMFNVLQNDIDDLACHLVKHGLNKKTKRSTGENNIQRGTKRKSWIWQHYSKFQNRRIKCNICHKNYTSCNLYILKVHLFYAHQICPDKEINKQNNQSEVIRQYFTKEGQYASKCKICNSTFAHGYNVTNLKLHMKVKHPLIIEKIRNKFKHSWVSENFVLNTSNDILKCKICCNNFDLFKHKVDDLANHLSKYGINKKTKKNTDGNDMNMNHQSEENNE
ncbi:hypothetical protein ALC60_04430 [Trachymyrmex zeteki]|uniref:BED-type domain-containing protein n=1 Tax=Mycetomoellerius zeteki TaxID=64791 RepID=A0A151X939_9HYME|nr:hypothetical protein ALC60_04430 [Trachymyrmex zeteki]